MQLIFFQSLPLIYQPVGRIGRRPRKGWLLVIRLSPLALSIPGGAFRLISRYDRFANWRGCGWQTTSRTSPQPIPQSFPKWKRPQLTARTRITMLAARRRLLLAGVTVHLVV